MSRDGNQIFVGEFELDGVTSVITVVNGKCITFALGFFDMSDNECVLELVEMSKNIGLGTEESDLMYPMIYGRDNTYVDVFQSPRRADLKCVTVGEIGSLPKGVCEKVRSLMHEYESV